MLNVPSLLTSYNSELERKLVDINRTVYKELFLRPAIKLDYLIAKKKSLRAEGFIFRDKRRTNFLPSE